MASGPPYRRVLLKVSGEALCPPDGLGIDPEKLDGLAGQLAKVQEMDVQTAVVLGGCTLPNWNDPSGTVYQPCTYARGGLRIRPDDNSNTIHLSVEIDIESYVLGISESPYFWGSTGGNAISR